MTENPEAILRDIVADLISHLGVDEASVRVEPQTSSDGSTHYFVAVGLTGAARIIGRSGEGLNALQHLTRLIATKRIEPTASFDPRRGITLDIDGYRQSLVDRWLERATKAAEDTFSTGQTHRLPPLPAYLRRAVHLMITERFPELTTKSLGNGLKKAVVISKA